MKRFVLFTFLIGLMCTGAFAQDDMYFKPKKKTYQRPLPQERPEPYVYNRCPRDVDEYNRWGNFQSQYVELNKDSIASDVFEMYPDSIPDDAFIGNHDYFEPPYDPEEDFSCCKRMSRFDDYCWEDPWNYGWYGPYYYSRWWWYDPWYDPWFYGYAGWYGYYRPWGGWYYPSYWYGGNYISYRGFSGTRNHGVTSWRGDIAGNNFNGSRSRANTSNFSSRRGYGEANTNGNTNNSFNGNRPNNSPSRSNSFSSRSSNSGSFGGSRGGSFGGGGGSMGGSRGGGGGHFGGGRR